MKTAISVDLGGASYSLDEAAFLALHAYLGRAADRLRGHPDRDEVLAGLERTIGAKLSRGDERSAPIGAAEMTAALKEVGKVDGPPLAPERADRDGDGFEHARAGAPPDIGVGRIGGAPPELGAGRVGGPPPELHAGRARHAERDFDPDSHAYAVYSATDGPRPRRLYRLSDGKMIAGVCAGLAAYIGIDVGLMRALTVIAAVFTGFFLIIAAYVALMLVVPVARTSTEIAAAHGALRSA